MNTREYNDGVRAFSDGLYRFALKHVSEHAYAQDLVQEAFARVWVRRDDIQAPKLKSYLFSTVHNLIVDSARKHVRDEAYRSLQKDEGRSSAQPDLKDILDEALARLTKIQKTVLLLRDYEGYNYDEIGEMTQLSESQVKVYIFRARKSMKQYIGRLDLVL